MRLTRFLLALTPLLAACGGSDAASPTSPTPGTGNGSTSRDITVSNNSFSPSTTNVPVGATVTWTWASDAVTHNVTFGDGTASTNRSSGTFQRTFATAGTYTYRCTIHAGMTGTITVQ